MKILETIKVENRQFANIHYHNERFNRSRQALFGATDMMYLEEIINIPKEIGFGIYKCRIIYDMNIHNMEFVPYHPKLIQSLQLIQADDINYNYKYLDRNVFTNLLSKASEDDVLIIKNGFLTDASYANIVFWDGTKWLTPSTPLLYGTKRQVLLDAGAIIEAELKPADLKYFYDAKLINAMLDWENAPTIPIENIKFPE